MSDHTLELDDTDESWEEEWAAEPRHRSRWRTLLVLALAGALVFLGGVEVQKRYGSSSAATASGLPSGMPSGMPTGMPSGMFGGTGADGSQEPSSGSTDDSTGGSTAEAATQVIGTVVRRNGSVWIVKDLGGTRHRIKVSGDTKVVLEKSVDPDDVAVGSTVDITLGTDDSDTAASVTVR